VDIIHEEKLTSGWFIVLIGGVTVWLIYALASQVFGGPLGGESVPTAFLVGMILLLGAAAVTFARLTVQLTPRTLTVRFGALRRIIPVEQITGCAPDDQSWVRYGGFGIRYACVRGKRRQVYNVIGAPRLVVSLRDGREFAFSTRKSERVCELLTRQCKHTLQEERHG